MFALTNILNIPLLIYFLLLIAKVILYDALCVRIESVRREREQKIQIATRHVVIHALEKKCIISNIEERKGAY